MRVSIRSKSPTSRDVLADCFSEAKLLNVSIRSKSPTSRDVIFDD